MSSLMPLVPCTFAPPHFAGECRDHGGRISWSDKVPFPGRRSDHRRPLSACGADGDPAAWTPATRRELRRQLRRRFLARTGAHGHRRAMHRPVLHPPSSPPTASRLRISTLRLGVHRWAGGDDHRVGFTGDRVIRAGCRRCPPACHRAVEVVLMGLGDRLDRAGTVDARTARLALAPSSVKAIDILPRAPPGARTRHFLLFTDSAFRQVLPAGAIHGSSVCVDATCDRAAGAGWRAGGLAEHRPRRSHAASSLMLPGPSTSTCGAHFTVRLVAIGPDLGAATPSTPPRPARLRPGRRQPGESRGPTHRTRVALESRLAQEQPALAGSGFADRSRTGRGSFHHVGKCRGTAEDFLRCLKCRSIPTVAHG